MNINIEKIYKIANKPLRKIIGLMSGTSLDGLDVALCSIEGQGINTKLKILKFETVSFDIDMKAEIKSVFSKKNVDHEKITLLNPWIALQHAAIINSLLKKWNIKNEDVDLIASHGQTIYHAPKSLHKQNKFGNATLQIADGDHLAVATGIITISDFRQKHIAARGEGAPLAVYGDYLIFGKPGEKVNDPYFEGKGPERTGCILCGGCMVGCRYNSKNTLDKNYLHLAQQLGCEIIAEKEVYDVIPLNEDGSKGYEIRYRDSLKWVKKKETIKTRGVIFSGGVLGTVDLMLKLKEKSLPNLSGTLGHGIRTNSESLIGVTTFRKDLTLSDGIAIGSILHIDENRHIEPVRYSAGSGFWRIFMAPMVSAETILGRLSAMIKDMFIHPISNFKAFFVDDWAKRTHILLYMESIDSTLRFRRNFAGGMSSGLEKGKAPTAFNPIAQTIAHKVAKIINGKPMVLSSETLFAIPTTAHILGGVCMGKDASEGVIDASNQVINYKNMMVCDGSAISANPGVNPSLSITAITERAMSLIPINKKL